MNKIHNKLEKLADLYEAKEHYVRQNLLPPLSKEQVLEQCDWFPYELPSEIIDMYTWSGGCDNDSGAEYPFILIEDAAFTTIEAAKREYLFLQETEEREETEAAFEVKLDSCFPIAVYDYSSYSVACSDSQQWQKEYPNRVIATFELMEMHFHSIDSMLDTHIEWLQHPSWSMYGESPETFQKIWRKHNPGVKFLGEEE